MAESAFMFGVVIGMFVVLIGIVFGTRAKRYSAGYAPAESHGGHSGE